METNTKVEETLEEKMARKIRIAFNAKERTALSNINKPVKLGNNRIISKKTRKKIFRELNIDLDYNNVMLFKSLINQEREKRQSVLLKEAAEIYETIVNKMSTLTPNSEQEIRKMTEKVLWEEYDAMVKQQKPINAIRLENIRKDYLQHRNMITLYYDRLIGYVAWQVEEASHYYTQALSHDDILEIAGEYFLQAYYDYIRKYNLKEKSSKNNKLSTYFINRVNGKYRKGNNDEIPPIRAGRRMTSDLKMTTSAISLPQTLSNIRQPLVFKAIERLTAKLDRDPTIAEISKETGYSIYLVDNILQWSAMNQDIHRIDDEKGRKLDEVTTEISDDMKEQQRQAYKEILTDYGKTKGAIDEINEEYGMPRIEDGIIVDTNEEEEIQGQNPSSEREFEIKYATEFINNIVNELCPRDAKIIRLRFGLEDGRPRTLEEIGQLFGVTRERIRQIEIKALGKLRRKLITSQDKTWVDYMEKDSDEETYNPINMTTPESARRKI